MTFSMFIEHVALEAVAKIIDVNRFLTNHKLAKQSRDMPSIRRRPVAYRYII
jgi:hypothetical protein